MDQRAALRLLRQLRCRQIDPAQHPAASGRAGGRIADTPGFASLEANRAGFIPKENLEHAFPEFGPYLGQCQFTGCSHRTEKGCAIRAALAEGKLSQTRYDSYCAMYEEVKDVKDWQRRGM